MKGTVVFVSGVVGGIVTLVWGGACFIGGCVFAESVINGKTKEKKSKMNGEPHLTEVK